MNETELFTTDEQQLLEGKHLFLLKQSVSAKLLELFGNLHDALHAVVNGCPLPNRQELLRQTGKISKGENYLGFPWMILDYPRQFSRDDVFAFRSLCWWGNEYSFTLHLSGKYMLDSDDIVQKLKALKGKDLYICISESPWNYHFGVDNYIYLDTLLMQEDAEIRLKRLRFLKLSRKLAIHETYRVINEACNTFEVIAGSLFARKE